MTSGIVLGIGLCFDNHAPEQTAVVLAFHQPAANQVRSHDLSRTTEEGVRKGWGAMTNRTGYGSGLHFSEGAYAWGKRQQLFRSNF